MTGQRPSSGSPSAAGFTLIELLTALVVLGVATTILLNLFTTSRSLAESARTHEIASGLAEEYLALLQSRPELFSWPSYLDETPGTPLPVRAREGGPVAASFMEPPAALPLARRAHDRERATYSDFTWSAFATLPSPQAGYVELTVQIAWELDGRLKQIMLTSAVPRAAAEGVGP
jgi:prepilin-type N-terminal cleavage/methylation domain-containing protein